MVPGPARSKKSEKNVLLKHVFHSFFIYKLLCIVFMLDVHVFVKQHKLVDLRDYDSRRAGQQGPIRTLTAALKRSIKTVTGCIFYTYIVIIVTSRIHIEVGAITE